MVPSTSGRMVTPVSSSVDNPKTLRSLVDEKPSGYAAVIPFPVAIAISPCAGDACIPRDRLVQLVESQTYIDPFFQKLLHIDTRPQ
jgi:hypothetical protein